MAGPISDASNMAYTPVRPSEEDNSSHQGSSSTSLQVGVNKTPVNQFQRDDDEKIDTKSPFKHGKLKIFGLQTALVLGLDIFLTATPIFFLFLCIAARHIHNEPTQDNWFGDRVVQATKIGPTLFPIVFAAIVGRSMRMIATFSAERGAKLGKLELMTSSQSTWATFENQIQFRQFTPLGISILFLWALSPIGGQASLRLITTRIISQNPEFKLRYLMTGPAAAPWKTGGFGETGTVFEYMENSLFAASLLSPDTTKNGPRDTWGNVKIPRIEYFEKSFQDTEGWIKVPINATTPETFSSLVGLPIVGLPADLNSTFNLESSYWSLDCSKPTRVTATHNDFDWRSIVGIIWHETDFGNSSGTNPLNPLPNSNVATGTGTYQPTLFLDTFTELGNKGRQQAYFGVNTSSVEKDAVFNETRKIIFGSFTQDSSNNDSLVLTNCSITEVHVETGINCTQGTCAASKIRRSRLDYTPSHLTTLDSSPQMDILSISLPASSGGDRGQEVSSLAETFINNTALTSYSAIFKNGFVDLSLVSKETLSARLGIVLNTNFQLITFPGSFLGNQDQNLSAYGPETTPSNAIKTCFGSNATLDDIFAFANSIENKNSSPCENGSPFVAAAASGIATRGTETYACSTVWLILLLISTLVLLATGFYGIVVKQFTLAPDIFSYVTSMTYENPHVRLPRGGTTLDSIDRGRLLKDLNVKIGDVRGEEEIGYIAFTSGMKTRRLEKGRNYI